MIKTNNIEAVQKCINSSSQQQRALDTQNIMLLILTFVCCFRILSKFLITQSKLFFTLNSIVNSGCFRSLYIVWRNPNYMSHVLMTNIVYTNNNNVPSKLYVRRSPRGEIYV